MTEDLLERSVELADSVDQVMTQVRNSTKTRWEAKKHLRSLKQKVRALREDIETQIEIEKEKASKAEGEEDKKSAEEKVQLFNLRK